MRRQQVEGTLAEVEAMIEDENAAAGYPRMSVPDGPGPHTPIMQTAWAIPEQSPDDPDVYAMPVRGPAHRRRLLRRRYAGRRLLAADIRNRTWRSR